MLHDYTLVNGKKIEYFTDLVDSCCILPSKKLKMSKSGLILVAQVLLVGCLATSALAMKCPLPSKYLNSLDLKPIEKYCAKGI